MVGAAALRIVVMAGLDPAIHSVASGIGCYGMDARMLQAGIKVIMM